MTYTEVVMHTAEMQTVIITDANVEAEWFDNVADDVAHTWFDFDTYPELEADITLCEWIEERFLKDYNIVVSAYNLEWESDEPYCYLDNDGDEVCFDTIDEFVEYIRNEDSSK